MLPLRRCGQGNQKSAAPFKNQGILQIFPSWSPQNNLLNSILLSQYFLKALNNPTTMKMITIIPAILVIGAWFSTLTQAAPVTDAHTEELLARKLSENNSDPVNTVNEELRAIHRLTLQHQMAEHLAEERLRAGATPVAKPAADPSVLEMRKYTYCLENADQSIRIAVFQQSMTLGCGQKETYQLKAKCYEQAMSGHNCPTAPNRYLYVDYREPAGSAS
ncbi:hypothetical protein H0H93_006953 [Arthromyces matolae]|nr:hypothetical protein H0H93_006953 [Arthromyces matolae]